MKINLFLSLISALFFAVSVPSLSAASSAAYSTNHMVLALQAKEKATGSIHFKKEKHTSWLKKWWGKKASRHFQKSKWIARLSLGFVGFLVMILGGMFIVLGIVIPYLGILFLVLGIIIAFVGLLLWVLLSRIGVRVSSGNGQGRNSN